MFAEIDKIAKTSQEKSYEPNKLINIYVLSGPRIQFCPYLQVRIIKILKLLYPTTHALLSFINNVSSLLRFPLIWINIVSFLLLVLSHLLDQCCFPSAQISPHLKQKKYFCFPMFFIAWLKIIDHQLIMFYL